MPIRKSPGKWMWWLLVAVALALAVAVAEVAWMGERVSTHRALRAAAGPSAPSTKLPLPLTGFKP